MSIKNALVDVTASRRAILKATGGVAGLIALGGLSGWGILPAMADSVSVRDNAQKLLVTNRAWCSGCQRCEIACTLRNDGYASQQSSRLDVWRNYQFGSGVASGEGIFGNIEYTVETCKQCAEAACEAACPTGAMHRDPEDGVNKVDEDVCIGCGACAAACPWHMPVVKRFEGVSTKCIACGRCAEQCPNGAIMLIDWQDIAAAALESGIVSTIGLVDLAD